MKKKLANVGKHCAYLEKRAKHQMDVVKSIAGDLKTEQERCRQFRLKNKKLKKQLRSDTVKIKYLVKKDLVDASECKEVRTETPKEAENKENELNSMAALVEENVKLKSELESTKMLLEVANKLQKETNERVDISEKMVRELTTEGEEMTKISDRAIERLTRETNSLKKTLSRKNQELAKMKKKCEEYRTAALESQGESANLTPEETFDRKITGKWKLVRDNGPEDMLVPAMCANWIEGTLIYKLKGDTFRSDVQLGDVVKPELQVTLGVHCRNTMNTYSTTVRRDGGLVTEGNCWHQNTYTKFFMTRFLQDNGELRIQVIVSSDVAAYFFKKID